MFSNVLRLRITETLGRPEFNIEVRQDNALKDLTNKDMSRVAVACLVVDDAAIQRATEQ